MGLAVTNGSAGTGQYLTGFGLAGGAGKKRVYQASYPGVPESVAAVRHQVAAVLAGVPCAEDVIYALSEVVTNAVVHSQSGEPGGEFAVIVDVIPGWLVRIAVIDQGGPWKESAPDFYPHGLEIVRRLAASVRIADNEDGRTVRVFLRWETNEMTTPEGTATNTKREVSMEHDALTGFGKVSLDRLKLAADVLLSEATAIPDSLEVELVLFRERVERALLLPS